MKHNVHGSLLTNAHLCEQTHSATARHEYAAKRNTNGTSSINPDLTFHQFNQKEGLIPRSLLRNKLFQDMEEEIY